MSRRPVAAACLVFGLGALAGCDVSRQPSASGAARPATEGIVTRGPFGTAPDGTPVEVYTLTNRSGIEVRAITYGGIIVSLKTPDRAGHLDDIVLGFDDLAGYVKDSPYFGAIIGRYANRIGRGCFTLDGQTYQLATNDGTNHLHGGRTGFDKVVWQGEPVRRDRGVGVIFTHTSADGDEGYPGSLRVRVAYVLTDANELAIDYLATTDKPTPINLTQHTYFNLAGNASEHVLDHMVQIDADSYTPVDATLIPTGVIAPVDGTPFDFRKAVPIRSRVDMNHEQITRGRGIDHNFVLRRVGSGLTHAARVVEPRTGRALDVRTTEPGVQFYTGNFLNGTITGKGGRVYGHRAGFTLETQHYPDSPNRDNFPPTILRPGQEYRSQTVFAFGTAPSS